MNVTGTIQGIVGHAIYVDGKKYTVQPQVLQFIPALGTRVQLTLDQSNKVTFIQVLKDDSVSAQPSITASSTEPRRTPSKQQQPRPTSRRGQSIIKQVLFKKACDLTAQLSEAHDPPDIAQFALSVYLELKHRFLDELS